MLATLLVRGPFHSEDRNWIMRVLLRIYDPVLNWAVGHRKMVLSCAVLLLAAALVRAVGCRGRYWLLWLACSPAPQARRV